MKLLWKKTRGFSINCELISIRKSCSCSYLENHENFPLNSINREGFIVYGRYNKTEVL